MSGSQSPAGDPIAFALLWLSLFVGRTLALLNQMRLALSATPFSFCRINQARSLINCRNVSATARDA